MIDIADVSAQLHSVLTRVQITHDLDDWNDALWYATDWSELFAELAGKPARVISTIPDLEKAIQEFEVNSKDYHPHAFYDNEISQHVINELSKADPNFGFGSAYEYIDMAGTIKSFLLQNNYVSIVRNDGETIWFKERF